MPAERHPTKYQMVRNGEMIKMSSASREELEEELMRAYDVIDKFDDMFHSMLKPAKKLANDFLMGRSAEVDEVVL